MTAAPSSPLVERVAKAIADARGHGMREKEVVAAQAAIAACEFEAICGILKRLIGPYCGPDSEPLEDILRDTDALLARLEAKP
ncbi:hypothetical protein P12x_005305 [Tundrisphaera lichenicola]|uniref:hypothetical protein n=1 Tax=Tundrisphaera lichenicola TaxID=2029860 RepID=UPI003EBC77BD